ncbi:BON domain-containing protein [Roseivivax sediminis]|uniref:BON domain-containing protein n=1 Tax=Roseivivax sediminis TaxID=936889 RepID=A0A1I1VKI7_9RHOB|nr:BON domain-containing protein [Roseivivax sediminis]SFD83592.1 BON domain-containing protein [Roseivivax sediminis]
MSQKSSFRAWSDQHYDPETERGLHRRADPADPQPAGAEDIEAERAERMREIERERAMRRDPRLGADPWPGPEVAPETVAWPWAGPIGQPRRHRAERSFLDRARDELATWIGDEEAARRRDRDYTGVGPRNYRRSDTRIAEDVNDDLTEDPMLDATDIEVTVRDCEVTLDGYVRDRASKRRAEDCADHVSGVVHVQNNLRISDPPAGGSEASAPGAST